MIALRIRGLYAAALTQLFHPHDDWEIVQPSEDVRACINSDWRMDSPDVDIDDTPDEQGQRHTLRITGPAEAAGAILAHLQHHCFDVITRQERSEVGALYMGILGIVSRVRRQAMVYLGEDRVGILPLRYEDQDMRVGSYLPVRIEATTHENTNRPQLSKSLTIPGQYAVLTAARVVRLSKQITDEAQRERLQQLGEAQSTDGWGIIWRTAAQHAADDVLVAEIQRLAVEAQDLQERLQNVTAIGRVRGGELTTYVYMSGQAKATCDTLRAQILPTLPGHHKYKARGDVYGATVDALEKELPAIVLSSRTANLSVLASINALQQPIEPTLRVLRRAPDGRMLNQGDAQRTADDINAGWVEVRKELHNKGHYPRGLQIPQTEGDYAVTRFHEGGWHYITRYYSPDNTWQGDYAGLTTPIAIFSDHIHLADLHVAVLRSQAQEPEVVGINILERLHEQGIVTKALVDKVREESNTLLRQWGPETPTDASTPS
jgi:hypothetical protein